MRYLGGMDTMFVRAETPSMLLHVTGVMMIDPGAIEADDTRNVVRDLIACRLPTLPPLRWRLVEPPGGLGSLRWIEDPNFDLDRHVLLGTVPAPGDRRDLEQFVARVAADPLDRHRPLWEMHILDGMADGSLAVVAKFHHAFMDGGAGMELLGSLFDLDPDTEMALLADVRRTEAIPTPWSLLVDTPRDVLKRISRVPAVAARTITGVGGLVGAMFPRSDSGHSVSLGHRSPFNGALTEERVVSLADCSLSQVKQIGATFNVTVNDVVLAAVTSSLRSELLDEQVPEGGPLIAAVPVAVRPTDSEETYGNHTSAMMVPLPTDLDDPIERLLTIHRFTAKTKERHRAMGPDLLELWASLVPPWLISAGAGFVSRFGFAGHLPPVFNLIISNVAGPSIPIYLAGAELTGVYPLGPLIEGAGLNITVLSQCDTLHIGVIGDPTIVKHPSAVASGIAQAVSDLQGIAASANGATAGAR